MAQSNLGVMYGEGRSVPQDDAEAVRWYLMAAEQENTTAQNNLGVMYVEGRSVPQDDAEAVRWYRMAAEQGLASAQTNLGWMYENGRGVPHDDAEAFRWYPWLPIRDVIARHPRCYEREDVVFDPVHYLPLIERKINALDQAKPLAEWDLPEEFQTLRRLMEAHMLKMGRREYVQVLRLLETFGLDDLHGAVKEALRLSPTTTCAGRASRTSKRAR